MKYLIFLFILVLKSSVSADNLKPFEKRQLKEEIKDIKQEIQKQQKCVDMDLIELRKICNKKLRPILNFFHEHEYPDNLTAPILMYHINEVCGPMKMGKKHLQCRHLLHRAKKSLKILNKICPKQVKKCRKFLDRITMNYDEVHEYLSNESFNN